MTRPVPLVGESGYLREENDKYFTPEWVTRTLVERHNFKNLIWECAAGDLKISRVLREVGYDTYSTDIKDYGQPLDALFDFLTGSLPADLRRFDIVTNPPFRYGDEFVERALDLVLPRGGDVALLLSHDFDCAKTRRRFFNDHPKFRGKITLTKRIVWFPDRVGKNGKKTGPRKQFDWYLWSANHYGAPIILYGP